MSDSFITLIIIILVVILMFMFPMNFITSQNDVITSDDVNELTAEFVNAISKDGKITGSAYYDFMQRLSATGNTYKIELEVQKSVDSKEGINGEDTLIKKVLIGDTMYYSVFTNEIEAEINANGFYTLNNGDNVKVTVKNENKTLGTQTQTLLYGATTQDDEIIETTKSALVVADFQDYKSIPNELASGRIRLNELKWIRDFYWVSPHKVSEIVAHGGMNPGGGIPGIADDSISNIEIGEKGDSITVCGNR